MHHKHRKARGFIKLSVMINQETREILAFRVTDERKGDSTQFKDLVNGSLGALGLDPESLRAGGPGEGGSQGTRYRCRGGRESRRKIRSGRRDGHRRRGIRRTVRQAAFLPCKGMPEGSL